MDTIPFKCLQFWKNSGLSKVLNFSATVRNFPRNPVFSEILLLLKFWVDFLQQADWHELLSFPSLKSLTAPLSVSHIKNCISWRIICHTPRSVVLIISYSQCFISVIYIQLKFIQIQLPGMIFWVCPYLLVQEPILDMFFLCRHW